MPAKVLSAEYTGSFSHHIDDIGPNGSSAQTRTLSWVMPIYDAHIQHIYAKIGVSTRAGAALFAMRHHLLEPDP